MTFLPGSLLSIAVSALALVATCLAAPIAHASDDPFDDWPAGTSPTEIGSRVAARFLEAPHMFWTEKGTIHYAEVCTWYGALTYAELAESEELTARLIDRFEPFFGPEEKLLPPVNHVDHSVFGAVPLEIYRQTARARYRTFGLAYADGQWDNPLPDGLSNQTRFWIDDMFMITVLQAQAFRATGDARYRDRAAAEMVVYLDRLQQPNGLFFHAPGIPFFWGRGNGWMAAGTAELLRVLPVDHPNHARILAGYRAMMATLLKHQAPDGMWRQLIDQQDSWPETSCTGMFTFAFITGVKDGWLDAATYGPAARKGWLAVITYLDEDAALREVCVGTGTKNDRQYYLDRPRSVGDMHGQAPLLWCASALLR